MQMAVNSAQALHYFYFFAVLGVSFETMVSAMSFMVFAACSEGRTSIGGT